MATKCDMCDKTPCESPRLCGISRAAQALMAEKKDGECNGCRQGLPEGDSAHTKGTQCTYG